MATFGKLNNRERHRERNKLIHLFIPRAKNFRYGFLDSSRE